MIKSLGDFRELRPGVQGGVSLSDARGAMAAADADEVAAYLDSAESLATTGRLVDDLLDPQRTSVAREEVATDGEWVWPRVLAYYVRQYRVGLPAEFVDMVKSRHGTPPPLTEADLERVEQQVLPS